MPAEEACDVQTNAPPSEENPLPPYGELFKKRQLKIANVKGSSFEDLRQKKRGSCLKSPMQPKCIPKEVVLPFAPQPSTTGRYLETDSQTGMGPGNLMKGVRVGRGDVAFPGWLIELADPQIQAVVDAKELLATGKPLCEIMDSFYEAISGLGAGITEDEVKEVLRRVPISPKGWSFSHFMFIAGNPSFAKKKGVIQDALPREFIECKEKDEEASTQSKTGVNKKKNVVDRLYQLPKIVEDDPWPPKGKSKDDADDSGYTQREQLFYSALLYCEMYDTMHSIEKMYLEGTSIPEPRDKILKRQQETGFGVSDLGTRKLGFAEWDRPLPPLPKISPYISDFPLVGKRRKVVKPNGEVLMYKRSQTSLKPLFLAVKAPTKPHDTIKILEDDRRIKSILNLLASQGNCLAMLPNVHSILHLSDTVLGKLEEIRHQNGPKPPKLYRGNDMLWITNEAKNLFRPHGLPTQIAKIPPLITFTDGLKLRSICKQVRDQHWSYICLRKNQFRITVWHLMHVERIPCGNLRESFVYSFETYLPAKSNFPILNSDSLPW